jgi:hypothetical protein
VRKHRQREPTPFWPLQSHDITTNHNHKKAGARSTAVCEAKDAQLVWYEV